MSVQNITRRVAIITGASSGIGEALVHEFGKAGIRMALAARRVDKLEALAQQYPDTLVVQTDVTVEAQCRALVEKTVEHFGRLDILVNNAGISMSVNFEDITDLSLFHKVMDVNYFGSVYCTYFALPHLKKSNVGHIVGVMSMTAKTGTPTRSAYAASKHAMQGFFDSLRIELMDTNIDITLISPGFVQSEVRINGLGADGKPRNESHLDEGNIMTAEECARQMMDAIQKRKRDVIITEGRAPKLVPLLRVLMPKRLDRMVMNSVKSGKT